MPSEFIDLSAIVYNARKIASRGRLIAVVKANAYGLGSVRVARALDDYVDGFAVAVVGEAEELLASGIKKDILVLGPSNYALAERNVVYTVSSAAEIDKLSRKRRTRFALKVNTGMNRYGAAPHDVSELAAYASECGELVSVYSHLRCPSHPFAGVQLSEFLAATEGINAEKHIAASGAFGNEDFALDCFRCGIALYGGVEGFADVVKITAPILTVGHVSAGDGVGYGSEVSAEDTDIAVLGIGYADGYRRLTAPRYVAVNGVRCKVLAVCMDATIVAIPHTVSVYDAAEILGNVITLDELAQSYGTIPYEVLTGFDTKRMEKIYGSYDENRITQSL